MGVGEIGVAPVLDGEGTRRTQEWLQRYFENPPSVVPGQRRTTDTSAPTFARWPTPDRAAAHGIPVRPEGGPASPNYPRPPSDAPGQAFLSPMEVRWPAMH